LISWLKRADFKDIRCFYDEYLSEDEQRSTEWARVKSFSDFFDKNTQKTVEGYPRARRIYIIAKK
jgi:tRNA (mo5U34)-methyltransferase